MRQRFCDKEKTEIIEEINLVSMEKWSFKEPGYKNPLNCVDTPSSIVQINLELDEDEEEAALWVSKRCILDNSKSYASIAPSDLGKSLLSPKGQYKRGMIQ